MIRERPLTRADYIKFAGELPAETVKGWACVDENDDPVAIGAYYFVANKALLFTGHVPEFSKKDRVRAARLLIERVKALPFDIVATCEEGSENFLRHLGFVPYGNVWRLQR